MPSTATQSVVSQTSTNFSAYCVLISSRPAGGTTQSRNHDGQDPTKSFPPFSPPIAINTDLSQLSYFTHSLAFRFHLPAGLCYEFVFAGDE
ncbi:hypothetical protein L209DRAFT_760822 [Thermothelomyces heterothallicus CBS 203.75]